MDINYDDMLEFVKQKIKASSRVNKFPFRSRYNHTLRVTKWAERLHEIEGGDLEVIRIACIFHDAGWDEKISHGIISRRIAEGYLNSINYNVHKTNKILEAIENHCVRDNISLLEKESLIVMDADILDEVGALTIIWDAMATAYEDEPSYIKAYERIKRYTLKLIINKKRLNTKAGTLYYEERLKLIDTFLRELEFELGYI